MKSITSAVFALAVWSTTAVSTDAVDVAPDSGRPWPGQPPVDCPFPKSDTLTRLGFTDRHAEYTQADTWYPSWAADGNLYSPWTDGVVNGPSCPRLRRTLNTGFPRSPQMPCRLSLTVLPLV